eukprot:6583247-Prymnesium_polylepis.1
MGVFGAMPSRRHDRRARRTMSETRHGPHEATPSAEELWAVAHGERLTSAPEGSESTARRRVPMHLGDQPEVAARRVACAPPWMRDGRLQAARDVPWLAHDD